MSGKLRSEDLRIISSTQEARADHTAGPEAASAEPRLAPDSVIPHEVHGLAIDIRDATLRYPLGAYVRGSLKENIFRLFGQKRSVRAEYVDALCNINLSIQAGERVGIIGSNGSGKSTLLRAMAGVYPLAGGSITLVGQIGTLLDIGLGFEVEATGRENIYYRGMAMGYSRTEIAKLEGQIIEFAGLGEFIDLPMRTYSSGMYVRLGFAVSTQFSPDILLIDEVFGAGDAAFSKLAVERMRGIVERAGIVVLASHDLGLVSTLCTRVLWVNRGHIERDGPASAVVPQFQQYMAGMAPATA